MKEIITHLAFPAGIEEAVHFYTGLFPDSRITGETRFGPSEPGPEGEVRTLRFELLGRKYLAVNGGADFQFAEGTSLLVQCDTQEEIDRLWDALGEGGQPADCGWVTDRFGLTWQITATIAETYLYGSDPAAGQRAVEATYAMKKIDISSLERAARGDS
ncbi:MAG: VOC family protein [Dehalococcoidia bacterium]|nr:VOC family protein [Dehalococcoidia bacterium]